MSAVHDASSHPRADDHNEAPGEFEILETAVRELAIARGLFSAAGHRQWLEWMDRAAVVLSACITPARR